MYIFSNAVFVFICGGIIGFFIELIFCSLFLYRKPFKSGFLFSFFIPMYGIGFLAAQHTFNASWFVSLNNVYLDVFLKVLILTAFATLLELITGFFYLKAFKTRLWDYSKYKFNFKGIINPLFTLFWMIIALCYYFIFFKAFNSFFKIAAGNIVYFAIVLALAIFLFIDLILSSVACLINKKNFTTKHLSYVEYKNLMFKKYGISFVYKLFKNNKMKNIKK